MGNSEVKAEEVVVPDLDHLINDIDPYLSPYRNEIHRRYWNFVDLVKKIEKHHDTLDSFTQSYKEFGVHVCPNDHRSVTVLEWLPAATNVFIRGDFNGWDRYSHRLQKMPFGRWQLKIAASSDDGSLAIPVGSQYKLLVETKNGELIDRLCPWSEFVQPPEGSIVFSSVMLDPADKYVFKHERPTTQKHQLRIYEAHIGISSEKESVASYTHFRESVLPRIVRQGYNLSTSSFPRQLILPFSPPLPSIRHNVIQLMAVMEHAYYASFGYQVTSFFAPSSRFGKPNDLRRLIDECHANGIVVLLDLIHSHASKNTVDGLNELDGTNGCYFHDNARGTHTLWDSRLFNYQDIEVLRFLLSNIRYWLDEFKFDGFRFDGVTSMLYHSHGLAHSFSGHYDEYFGLGTDTESFVYLMLANYFIHQHIPNAITIAEEVSGMPTLCRPVSEGGGGFDYRLAMAIPDLWIKILKSVKDEDWDLAHICFTLTNRRRSEANIAYAESHDQALVGDKTISFHLMDAQMYTNMSTLSELTPIIDRGLALHKMIRLLTYGLGGEGWLNFIGNEFGHPEWLDFPREGNNSSYLYARRQWNLVDDNLLRYKFLNAFDKAMNGAEERFKWLQCTEYISRKHEDDKVVVFERGHRGLLWIFNFHSNKSYTDYKVGCSLNATYKVVLDSDAEEFGGHCRIDHNTDFVASEDGWDGRRHSLNVYIPCRTALLLASVD